MFIVIVLILCSCIFNNTFNVDTLHPIKYDSGDDESNRGYFGYSIALYPEMPGSSAGILIGEPRGKTVGFSSMRPGTMFNCEINGNCNPKKLESTISFRNADIVLNNSWTGASIDVNHKNGFVVVCAPRLLWLRRLEGLIGGCYFFNLNQMNLPAIRLLPLYNENKFSDFEYRAYNYGVGQAGLSAHITTKGDKIVLGAPGMFQWEGSTILCEITNKYYPDFNCKTIGDAKANYKKLKRFLTASLLGYSSSSGYFQKNQLQYVAGAPRMSHRGSVFIYTFNVHNLMGLNFIKEFTGVQIGEYFGASISVGDTDNDGLDDLIVGSPFFSNNKYNEGRIYYFNSANGFEDSFEPIIIDGKTVGAQFGTCVQYLGDLDRDGYGEIAVAAPYEEDSGVVYIFPGCKQGLLTEYSQRIVGKSISHNLKGFGASISKTADIDSNNYLDLAIGAYKSGSAVILRTRPTVKIRSSLENFSSLIERNQTSFRIEVCFWVINNETKNINISRMIIVDKDLNRAQLVNVDDKRKNILINNEPNCENMSIALISIHQLDPILISLSYELEDTSKTYFCPNCPILDKYRSSPNLNLNMFFNLGCGDDKVCTINLTIALRISELKENTFIADSFDHIFVETNITNTGENSYGTKLLFVIPEMLWFRSIPQQCEYQTKTAMRCDIGNPLNEKSAKLLILDLDMSQVNNGHSPILSLNITAIVSSSGKNESSTNLVIKVLRDSNISINSATGPYTSYDYITENSLNSLYHHYQITKSGISSIHTAVVDLYIPTAIKHTVKNMEIIQLNSLKITFAGITYNCLNQQIWNETLSPFVPKNETNLPMESIYLNCSTPEVICSKVVCLVGPIPRKPTIVPFSIKMNYNATLLKNLYKSEKIVFSTFAFASILGNATDEEKFSAVASSLFVGLSQSSVDLWIIIIAVILGFLLLSAIIFGLVKAGFFRRETRVKLEKLIADEDDNN